MNQIQVDLKYCYGINRMNYKFDFNTNNVCVIYAPNGTMKTSFSKTFRDIMHNAKSLDKIYPERDTIREVHKSDNTSLEPSEVLVFESYNSNYESEHVSNLIVNKELKKEYDEINNELNKNKASLLNEISKLSGLTLKKGLEEQITKDFGFDNNSFFDCLIQIMDNYSQTNIDYSRYHYIDLVNEKVETLLKDKNMISLIKEYIDKYNEILESSTLFKKGVFNHNNANSISEALDKNGYFKAGFKLEIDQEGRILHITDKKQLDDLIITNKKIVLNNPDLIKRFDKIDSNLNKNKELKLFKDILEKDPEIILDLNDIQLLKRKIWTSYIKNNDVIKKQCLELIRDYNNSKEKIKKIIEQAKKESSLWDEVVDTFNNRFVIPFTVYIENQADVILNDIRPSLKFKYKDERMVDKSQLLEVLSRGEQRAFYIMNIIFELMGIKNDNMERLLIFDDIADSFDYRNKYAIVEYLKDIAEDKKLKIIILTHNFDFYRTVSNRINAKSLMTIKSNEEIRIENGHYKKDIFKIWKDNFFKKEKIFIASIPFIRNIAEYIRGNKSEEYKVLTSLLHIKQNTKELLVSDVESIYRTIWNTNNSFTIRNEPVYKIIIDQANTLSEIDEEYLCLENKIILSIAIRLVAEEFMIFKINNDNFVNSLDGNQTAKLFIKYKELFCGELENIKTLENVNLITPENIHLNSFMYEPILDISEDHLRKLYKEVKALLSIQSLEAPYEAAISSDNE